MLAMPHALASVGLIPGVLIIALCAFFSAAGLLLLSKSAFFLPRSSTVSFFEISKVTFPKFVVLFDLAIAVKCWGVSISYLVIVGDLMPKIMSSLSPSITSDSIMMNRNFWITLLHFSVVAPLSFLRQFHSLRYTSKVALLSVLYILLIVCGCSVFSSIPAPDSSHYHLVNFDIVNLFSAIPVFVFAFTCHQNIFFTINELPNPTYSLLRKIVSSSIALSFYIYTFLSVSGYLTFGDTVSQNILAQYSTYYPDALWLTLAQFAITLVVLLSYPLQCYPARASVDKILVWFQDDIQLNSVRAMSPLRFNVITISLLISSYLIAMFVTSLTSVLQLVGATGSTTICYILPGLFYNKLSRTRFPHRFDTWNFLALGLVLWGVFVMVVSVGVQIWTAGEPIRVLRASFS